jgi:hypothetical protein
MGVPGTNMRAWALEEGGVLSAEELDAVTAYTLDFQPAASIAASAAGDVASSTSDEGASSLWGGAFGLLALVLGALGVGLLAIIRS